MDLLFFYDPSIQSVTIPDYSSIKRLSIYDMSGRVRFTFKTLKSHSIDISSLSNGTYLVVLFDGSENAGRSFSVRSKLKMLNRLSKPSGSSIRAMSSNQRA